MCLSNHQGSYNLDGLDKTLGTYMNCTDIINKLIKFFRMKLRMPMFLIFLVTVTSIFAQEEDKIVDKKIVTEINTIFNNNVEQKPICKVSGSGDYNLHKVVTTGGKSNIKYSSTKQPSSNYKLVKSKLTVKTGESFVLEIEQSNNWSRTMIWIDWNKDGNFVGEEELIQVMGQGSQLNPGPFSRRVHVPKEITTGVYRMRLLTGDAWSFEAIPESVCNEMFNCSIKDFNIKII